MSEEVIEAKLCDIKGGLVIFVVPQYGHVSFSYIGELNCVAIDHPILFHFQAEGMSAIFRASDVDKIDDNLTPGPDTVIRLKSPHQYNEKYEHAE